MTCSVKTLTHTHIHFYIKVSNSDMHLPPIVYAYIYVYSVYLYLPAAFNKFIYSSKNKIELPNQFVNVSFYGDIPFRSQAERKILFYLWWFADGLSHFYRKYCFSLYY